MLNYNFTIEIENMKSFNPMEDIEILTSHSNVMLIRTSNLLPTLTFMQQAGRHLQELIPDDEMNECGDIKEFNILSYYK